MIAEEMSDKFKDLASVFKNISNTDFLIEQPMNEVQHKKICL
jgi:hypothetical protein